MRETVKSLRRVVTVCSEYVFIALSRCLVSACTMFCCMMTEEDVILIMMEYLSYVTLKSFPSLHNCKLVWLMISVQW